jgi:hypothetical protein
VTLDGCCDVCGNDESHEQDLIVICEVCEVAVHQSCYGIQVVPEGPWLCAPCSRRVKGARCVLCPWPGGALKRTLDGRWCHVACALWDPDTAIQDPVAMEPIVFVHKTTQQRRQLVCDFCGLSQGLCIQCCSEGCRTPVHALCARRNGYLNMTLEFDRFLWESYCGKHAASRVSAGALLARLLAHSAVADVAPAPAALRSDAAGDAAGRGPPAAAAGTAAPGVAWSEARALRAALESVAAALRSGEYRAVEAFERALLGGLRNAGSSSAAGGAGGGGAGPSFLALSDARAALLSVAESGIAALRALYARGKRSHGAVHPQGSRGADDGGKRARHF